ncbi:MAG TPA: aryl-sulfate sulfotransferase [Gemmatimonadaceae bacterium]|nr:aryl-sulfate sulfotransferase [Gemmatimonadaceae bacterium]
MPAVIIPSRGARPRALRALAAAAVLATAACQGGTDAPAVRVVGAELSAPAPLVRALDLTLDRPAAVTVDYWTEGDPHLRVRSASAEHHALLLARLRPGRSYQYEVRGAGTRGTFTTDPLPADLAGVSLAATGERSGPLVMLHLFDPAGFKGYAAVDNSGRVVWYWRTTDFPFGMARRGNGNFVFLDKGRGLLEVTPAGRVVHELAQDLASREQHHDAIVGPDNSVLFIAFDDRTVDGARVRGEAIWAWTPETGAVVKRWSVWDHFTFADAPAPRGSGEWMHGNALAMGPRQNILLSAHHWNQIISITPDWRGVEWRLGGVNATLPVPDAEQFSGQHTGREIAPGRVIVFDNGVDRGGYSRAVEFATDGGPVRKVWEWRPARVNFATAVGSARRLDGGRTLVAFGMSAGLAGSTGPTEVYEVAADGTPVWHLVVGTQILYRAEPLAAIGSEEVVP